MAMNKYLSIRTLSVTGLNVPIKRHTVAEWIRKYDPHKCCLQETHLNMKDIHRLKVKGWKKYSIQMDVKKERLGANTCIRQKRLQNKGITRDKGHYIMLKGVVQQENITLQMYMHQIQEYLNI